MAAKDVSSGTMTTKEAADKYKIGVARIEQVKRDVIERKPQSYDSRGSGSRVNRAVHKYTKPDGTKVYGSISKNTKTPTGSKKVSTIKSKTIKTSLGGTRTITSSGQITERGIKGKLIKRELYPKHITREYLK